jgi:hypothetical protein
MPANYVPVDPTDTNPALQQRMPIRDILKWVRYLTVPALICNWI